MKRRLAVLLSIALLFAAGLDALAQEPGDSPARASNAEWSIADSTFQSNYPRGFQFAARITSSAGPIQRGRVIWSHAPGTQRTRPIEIDPSTGLFTVVWEPGTGEAVPPWVGISYYWDLTDSEGNRFHSPPSYVEYEDNTHQWLRSESEDVIVFSQDLPAEVNQMTIDAMARQRDLYRAAWGDLLPYKPRAILFGSRSAWLEWQGSGGIGSNSSVVGTTNQNWGATVQVAGYSGARDMAYGTVPHEIGHLYQSEYIGFLSVSWFIEGNATFFEAEQQYDYLESVRHRAADGALPPLLQSTGPSIRGQNPRLGYDIGYTFFKWLTDTYGLDAHRRLVQNIRDGMTRNEAIVAVTGLSLEEAESRWRVWLGASPTVPQLAPTPTWQFLPSPTPYIFAK